MNILGKIKQYVYNVLISLDQLANTLVGGDPDETISSRCGKRVHSNQFCKYICFVLDTFDPRHCKDTQEADEGKDAVIK